MQYNYNTHTLSSKFTGLCLDDDVSADVIPLKFIEFGGVVSPILLFTEGARE